MNLLVDIGNSTTKVARHVNGKLSEIFRMDTDETSTSTVTRLVADVGAGGPIDKVIVSSVVPEMKDSWRSGIRMSFGLTPFFVTYTANLGMRVSYEAPHTIGADRLVNAVAAAHLYGAPAVVIDVGTAVTIDAVSRSRGFIGGIIAPGPGMMREYLADRTAQLLQVDLAPTARGIGKSTEEALRIGAWHGYRGMLKELIQCTLSGLRTSEATICATGGGAVPLCRNLGLPVTIEPNLTLLGLSRIAELNDPS